MSVGFDEHLGSLAADAETLVQAARYYLAEVTDDLSPDEMREAVSEDVGDEAAVEEALELLEDDPAALAAAAREILATAWEDPSERPRVIAVLDEARAKLPVIELGILSITAMYGMWLLTTRGVKRVKEKTRNADGSETEREIDYYAPDGPLRAVVDLLKGGGRSDSRRRNEG
jgi:hypothetical protein